MGQITPTIANPTEPDLAPRPDARSLDAILLEANPKADLADRVDWLIALVQWLRQPVPAAEANGSRSAHVRLKRLFTLMDRQPEWKLQAARTLRSIVRDTCALDLFCETGLPRENGFFSEAMLRLSQRLLPQPPYDGDLGTLFSVLFPKASDADWIRSLDEELCRRIRDLFFFGTQAEEDGWNTLTADMCDAVVHLSGQVSSVGGSTPVRARLKRRNFRELPFARLLPAVNAVLASLGKTNDETLAAEMLHLHAQLDACHQAIDQTLQNLEEFGVSPGLVYQLERMRSQLQRIENLVKLLTARDDSLLRHAEFAAELIRENQERLGLVQLWRDTATLFGRRLVDRSAEAGEHYIARTRAEYLAMLRSAAGGGAVTAVTMGIKVIVISVGMSPFFTGFFASVNYAASFFLIQVRGFTLATKQPATTAPALARQMHELRDPKRLDALVDEIIYLIRSQAAAIMGNILLVVPCAMLLAFLFQRVVGHPLLSPAKALATVQSLSIFGPSLLFAAITGVLLWLSGLFASVADNWFAYRRIGQSLEHNPRLKRWLGLSRLRRLVAFLHHNVAGLAGNISLGFLLGMFPEICHFVGLPLDVRHVTLSSAALAAAMTGSASELIVAGMFWKAVMGVLVIGLLNVGVSFTLALFLAIRARDVKSPERGLLYRALLQRLQKKPLSFLLPIPPR